MRLQPHYHEKALAGSIVLWRKSRKVLEKTEKPEERSAPADGLLLASARDLRQRA